MAAPLELFFPPYCVACGAVQEEPRSFCERCAEQVTLHDGARCAICSEPGALNPCARCRAQPPPFSAAYAPFIHEGAVARAIHLYKYEDKPELARPLGSLLAETARGFLSDATAKLCAIPLHVARFRERKYDQAHLLAVEVSRVTGLSRLDHALDRTRATERQVGLAEHQREENVRGAFQATGVEGQAVVLIDDVFTTGATARAAARALLDAGAASVRVLTLARAYTQ